MGDISDDLKKKDNLGTPPCPKEIWNSFEYKRPDKWNEMDGYAQGENEEYMSKSKYYDIIDYVSTYQKEKEKLEMKRMDALREYMNNKRLLITQGYNDLAYKRMKLSNMEEK